MSEKTYTIKPLKWERSQDSYSEDHRAGVGMGTCKVYRNRRNFEEDQPWESWRWSYCFDEYYDEYDGECISVSEGKKLCSDNWLSRLLPNLKPVKP